MVTSALGIDGASVQAWHINTKQILNKLQQAKVEAYGHIIYVIGGAANVKSIKARHGIKTNLKVNGNRIFVFGELMVEKRNILKT